MNATSELLVLDGPASLLPRRSPPTVAYPLDPPPGDSDDCAQMDASLGSGTAKGLHSVPVIERRNITRMPGVAVFATDPLGDVTREVSSPLGPNAPDSPPGASVCDTPAVA